MKLPKTLDHLHGKLVRLISALDGEVMIGAVILAYDGGEGTAQVLIQRCDAAAVIGFDGKGMMADFVPALVERINVIGPAVPPPPFMPARVRQLMDAAVVKAMRDYDAMCAKGNN